MSYPNEPGSVHSTLRRDGDVPGLLVGTTTARFIATGALTRGEFGLLDLGPDERTAFLARHDQYMA